MDLADDFLQNVLQPHHAGRAAEFVEHNRQSALLFLQTFQQLQQVHARRHEGRKLDHLHQVHLRIEQQRLGVEDPDDGVGCFVVERQPPMLEPPRRRQHVLQTQVIRDRRHRRARAHHVPGCLLVEVDDL